MDGKVMGRNGREELDNGQDSNGGGSVDTGLPIQQHNQEGSLRDTDIQRLFGQPKHSPLHVSDQRGPSAGERQDNNETDVDNSGGLCAGSDGSRGHSNGVEEDSLQRAIENFTTELTDVQDGHRQEITETNTGTSEVRLCDGHDILNGMTPIEYLNQEMLPNALKTINEAMKKPWPHPDDEDYAQKARVKLTAAFEAASIQLKVDDHALRHKQTSILEELKTQMEAAGDWPKTLKSKL